MRAGQQEAGSIHVIDSHDRWVDKGALQFSIAGSRNPCQGNGPAESRCYHERSFPAGGFTRLYARIVRVATNRVSFSQISNTIPLR